jgi:hypothetical protein
MLSTNQPVEAQAVIDGNHNGSIMARQEQFIQNQQDRKSRSPTRSQSSMTKAERSEMR